MTPADATAEVFFTAFKSLKNSERAALLARMLADSGLRRDILDIALIEESKKTKGKPISAADYFQQRKKA